MKSRPILFSAPMVRALLDGSKTQTRRVVKPAPPDWATFGHEFNAFSIPRSNLFRWSEEQTPGEPLKPLRRWPHKGNDALHDWYAMPCPYGKPGDQLWVRETWARDGDGGLLYRADCTHGISIKNKADEFEHDRLNEERWAKWRPSIFLPRTASRITVEIIGIRIERLVDISDADAAAEGCRAEPCDHARQSCADIGCLGPIPTWRDYRALWESINGRESWGNNPWVWVIEFKRLP